MTEPGTPVEVRLDRIERSMEILVGWLESTFEHSDSFSEIESIMDGSETTTDASQTS